MTAKERPILFSGAMVKALLSGAKTQTRRVMKPQPYPNGFHFDGHDILTHNDYLPASALLLDVGRGINRYTWSDVEDDLTQACPHGVPGEQLWVRETFFAFGRWITRPSVKKGRDEWHFVDMTKECGESYLYAADGVRNTQAFIKRRGDPKPMHWQRPAIFMPRAASRLTLEVTQVRVERLQDISEADCHAEGIESYALNGRPSVTGGLNLPAAYYRYLWDLINGAGAWDANPWVWAVSFNRVPQPC